MKNVIVGIVGGQFSNKQLKSFQGAESAKSA